MKKLLSTTVLALSLSASAIAFAGDGNRNCDRQYHHGGPKYMQAFSHKMAKKLELTDEQKTQMKALRQEMKPQQDRKDAMSPMAKIHDMDPNSTSYNKDLTTLADTAAENARQRILRMAEMHTKMQAILTAEQREKMQAFHNEKKNRRDADSKSTEK